MTDTQVRSWFGITLMVLVNLIFLLALVVVEPVLQRAGISLLLIYLVGMLTGSYQLIIAGIQKERDNVLDGCLDACRRRRYLDGGWYDKATYVEMRKEWQCEENAADKSIKGKNNA